MPSPATKLVTHELYADQLRVLDYGYALYDPDPGVGVAELQIGDVGYNFHGRFKRFASVFTPEPGIPAVDERKHEVERLTGFDKGILKSNSVESEELNFSLSASEPTSGASILVGFKMSCESDRGASLITRYESEIYKSLNPDLIKDHFSRHCRAYFNHAKTRYLSVKHLNDIILVTGRIMTADWATIAFHSHKKENSASFDINAATVTATGTIWGKWSQHVRFPNRHGPTRTSAAINASSPIVRLVPKDQCIFIDTFRVYEIAWFRKLLAWFERVRSADSGKAPVAPECGIAQTGNSATTSRARTRSGLRRTRSLGEVAQQERELLSETKSVTSTDYTSEDRDIAHNQEKPHAHNLIPFPSLNPQSANPVDIDFQKAPDFHSKLQVEGIRSQMQRLFKFDEQESLALRPVETMWLAEDMDQVLTAYDVLAYQAFNAAPTASDNSYFDLICIDEEDVRRLAPESCSLEDLHQQAYLSRSFSVDQVNAYSNLKVGRLQHTFAAPSYSPPVTLSFIDTLWKSARSLLGPFSRSGGDMADWRPPSQSSRAILPLIKTLSPTSPKNNPFRDISSAPTSPKKLSPRDISSIPVQPESQIERGKTRASLPLTKSDYKA